MFRNFAKSLGEVVEGPVRIAGGVVTLDEEEINIGTKKTVSGVVNTATLGIFRSDEDEKDHKQKAQAQPQSAPKKSC